MDFRQISREWRADWNKFAYEILGVRLDAKMQEILYDIQTNKKVSVCSGTSRGKDFLASVASMCGLYLTPTFHNGIFQPAQVLCTGPTSRQARTIMWGEISSRYNQSKLKELEQYGFNAGRVLDSGSIVFDMPSDADKQALAQIGKWRLDVFKAQDFNEQAWQGFHAEHFMAIVTEAAGVDQRVFNGIEGCLQNDSRLLIVFNPDIAHGEAYNSVSDPQYKFHRLSTFTAPNVVLKNKYFHGQITAKEYESQRIPSQVDWEWVDERVHKAGWTKRISKQEVDPSKHDFEWSGEYFRPQALFMRKVLALHVVGQDDTLIPITWIEQAMERWQYSSVKCGVMAVDVAGMGRDTTQKVYRNENYVSELKTIMCDTPALIHMNTAGVIEKDSSNFEAVYIDTIGEGAGVYSRLMELGKMNVYSFKNSYGAKSLRDTATGEEKFLNLRAYTFWELRNWLNPAFNDKAMLPNDPQLKEQLSDIQYTRRSDGCIQIESKDKIKERLGVSPDKADVLAQTFAPNEYFEKKQKENNENISTGLFL